MQILRNSRWNRLNACPHPDPLPQREGTAIVSPWMAEQPSCQCRHTTARKATNDSPSPGGEGWGEGGSTHQFCVGLKNVFLLLGVFGFTAQLMAQSTDDASAVI